MISPLKLLPDWLRQVVVVLLLWLVVCGSIVLVVKAVESIRKSGTEAGIQQEQVRTQDTILQRVEQARETAEQIDREADAGNGSLLYHQCLRSARTPANCERFLSAGSPDKH